MQGIGQRLGRGVGGRQAGRTAAGWFSLALAVTVAQAVVVSPAFAQNKPPTTAAVTDTALTWGQNDRGQLGNGTTTNSTDPVEVSLPAGTLLTDIAGGGKHSLALTSTGSLLAWGNNANGQLGDGTTTSSNTPVAVDLPAGTEVVAIAAGNDHSLALTSTGAVLAWGDNSSGQLGDGTNDDRSTPVTVDLPTTSTTTAIAAGSVHSLSLTSTGSAFAWGNNDEGQLGDESTTSTNKPVNVALTTGTTLTAIAGGSAHSLGITSDNTAVAWGSNSQGQLGDGTNTNALAPVNVALTTGTTVTAIAAGLLHSVALLTNGTAATWGNNATGQLGNGNNVTSNTPVEVSLPSGTTLTAIAANSSNHTVAITNTETALAWGDNSFGQLGTEVTTSGDVSIASSSNTPVAVNLSTGTTLTNTAVGTNHSLALPTLIASSTTTLDVSPQDPTADQDVTLTATVTCNTGDPSGSVTFRNNNTDLATVPLDTTNTATYTTTLPVGTNNLTADFTSVDTICPNSQSEAVTITVTDPSDPTDPTDPTDPDLPITGASLPSLLGTATLLILIGASFIVLTRRSRSTHHQK
ncbi:RCC1 domain-containing protein [Salinispora tropica]|uniref:LPXTG-motif cell wall anchor domain n=1 Tax=Salinispora tropica (strain ATCC BAA-916 / DSM 44818 / JCM 13857 / NBRC 105044 / CNB-440) TaxID=369723 RepID=A4X463_SALTO|nr:Ig-like domain repeat protein [Salinispora tropica]ABP53663.1 LPXTG-motif cell wall anchor domain [Salinispora tropica CNB-440]